MWCEVFLCVHLLYTAYTYLQYFIANLQSTILVGTALGVHAADEDAHLRSVAITGEADAQASQALMQVHQQR